MTIRKRLNVGLAWMFAGNWAEQVFNFAVFVILARLLGADEIGLAAMAVAFVLFAEFLVYETLTEVLIQRKTVDPGHLDAVFWSLAAVSTFLVLLIFVLAEPIASVYGEPQVADFLRWLSATILFVGLSGVPVALLRRKIKFGVLAMRASAGIILGGASPSSWRLWTTGPGASSAKGSCRSLSIIFWPGLPILGCRGFAQSASTFPRFGTSATKCSD